MTAANLLRQGMKAGIALEVVLIERGEQVGRGVAYGTTDPAHVLNVPAGRLSAWADEPDHFLAWARAELGAQTQPGSFLPRHEYGRYVQQTLESAARAAADTCELRVVHGEARGVRPEGPRGWRVELSSGDPVSSEALVLALGHRPPSDPLGPMWSGTRDRFVDDPWRPGALEQVRKDEPVLVLGSSLTAVDALLTLSGGGAGATDRRAPIWLLSRRGLLPAAHLPTPNPPADVSAVMARVRASQGVLTTRELVAAIRTAVRGLGVNGDWRTVVDGLRPHTPAIWNAMPLDERRRFIERVRPFWEVHRHRMAPHVAAAVEAMRSAGRFVSIAGRIARASAERESISVEIRKRGMVDEESGLITLRPSWIVNCTGPTPSNRAESNPVIASLLAQGVVRPDGLGLGLQTEGPGRVVDRQGATRADVYVVGTLRKPATWESTAVPELRQQAAGVAEAVIGMFGSECRVIVSGAAVTT